MFDFPLYQLPIQPSDDVVFSIAHGSPAISTIETAFIFLPTINMSSGTIFVTGGAGYVGSHCVLKLLEANFEVIVIDNFVNSAKGSGKGNKPESLQRVEQLTGRQLLFYEADLQDKNGINKIFNENHIDCVVHFAALKAVGESATIPLEYYRNNVGGTINLLQAMKENGVKKFIFSSSATVYGEPQYLPIDEKHPVGTHCTNPYGRTKYFAEEIIKDVHNSEKDWSVTVLRYFNPVGAHKSGQIGEDPYSTPNNLMPYISQVAVGRKPELLVFGGDYDTTDGTGVRDYIHIEDLAIGHVSALQQIHGSKTPGYKVYNLGTGCGFSVLQVIEAFAKASGKEIPHRIVKRRPGDVAEMYADVSLAEKELGWKAERTLSHMCDDTWRWQFLNPMGYSGFPGNDDVKS